MYAVPHIISEKGANKGSCSKYANYLLKHNDYFFNETSDLITLDEAIALIDENSKRRLGENDAKWYAPVYAFSEEESQHICFQLFKKKVENYLDLNDEEKERYNDYIIALGKSFQDVMAENFNKQDLGIKGGKDLFYIGVVEHNRKYTFKDRDVELGIVEKGKDKKGFNTHIHIIQSRLANNGKFSKISPEAKERKTRINNLGGRVGFDRGNFSRKIEMKFDSIMSYKRKIKDTFDYKNIVKKKGVLPEINGEKVRAESKEEMAKIIEEAILFFKKTQVKSIKKKFISSEVKNKIIENADCQKYFDHLMKIGLLSFEEEREGVKYYRTIRNEKIGVREKSWFNITTKNKGGIIKAYSEFERKNFYEALQDLADITKISTPKVEKKSLELVSQSAVNKKFLYKNYEQLGIENIAEKHLTSVMYRGNNGTTYRTLALKNQSGGYYAYNEKYNYYQKIGKGDISVITGSGESRCKALVFNNYMEYMSFLKIKKITKPLETIIILNDIENQEKLVQFLKREISRGELISISNYGGKNIKNILSNDDIPFYERMKYENWFEKLKQGEGEEELKSKAVPEFKTYLSSKKNKYFVGVEYLGKYVRLSDYFETKEAADGYIIANNTNIIMNWESYNKNIEKDRGDDYRQGKSKYPH